MRMMCSRRRFSQGCAECAAAAMFMPWAMPARASEVFSSCGLRAAGKLKTRRSSEIKASPLSIGFETLDRELFDPARTYAHAAELGVKWARCQTGWVRCEKEKGVYDFAWLDEVVDNLLKIGIQPWFNLGYGNPLYTPKADATAVGWVPVFDETAMQAWLAYTEKLAEHFKGRVKHWEIWNEPNIKGFWKPGEPDAAAYAKLVAQTAPIIRARVPGAVIIGCGFAGVPHGYFKTCLDNGLAKHVDKVSYHPYRPIPEHGYDQDVAKLRSVLKEHNAAHIGLWQGENGCPSKKGSAGALSQQDWNETRQAKWLLRRIVSDLRLEVELTSYFLIVDLVGYRGKVNLKGILRGEDYTPKPSYFAYQNLCALFDAETVRSRMKPFKLEGADGIETWAAGFKRHGKPLVAYWAVEDLTKDVPAKQVKVVIGEADKAMMPSPRLLDPLSGALYEIASFDTLPLADYPLIIADKSVFV
ncbi:MAG: beta-galactosidase [Kiritimatiellae bacterium]|nr:beta-galactosidase [Kiritimatiellia bacterium]